MLELLQNASYRAAGKSPQFRPLAGYTTWKLAVIIVGGFFFKLPVQPLEDLTLYGCTINSRIVSIEYGMYPAHRLEDVFVFCSLSLADIKVC